MLADRINVDLKEEILKKIKVNSEKYPVSKSKGNSIKYSNFGD
jgi:hypothetical protein